MESGLLFRRCLIIITALVVFLPMHHEVAAQDAGPTCPAGFDWQRLSGVGCVQANCFDVANARLSYTSSCICNDGYKGCYEPVDYEGFDRDLCGPNCPVSVLISCVTPDALCPGEEPASEFQDTEPPQDSSNEDDGADTTGEPRSVDELARDLEGWLKEQGWEKPSEGQTAAAAVSLSTLLAVWLINHLVSGGDLRNALRAIQTWRGKDNLSDTPANPSHETISSGNSTGKQDSIPDLPDTGVPNKPVSQSHFSGTESAEQSLRKGAIYTEEAADALAKSRKQLNDLVGRIPEWVKKDEWWEKNVKPNLEKVNGWTDPTKVQGWVTWLQGQLDVRDKWYRDARHVPRGNTGVEGGIWVERGLHAGGQSLSEGYRRLVTDPAKTAVSKLPKSVADPINKAIDEQQTALEGVGGGISKLPRTAVRNITGGEQRHQYLDELRRTNPQQYRETQEVLHIPTRPHDRPDFGKGLKKVQPLIDGAKSAYERFRSWLDRNGPVFFRRIPKGDY